MSVHTYIMYLIPAYVVIVAIELYISRKRGLRLYTKSETFASLSLAVVQRALSLLPLGLVATFWFILFEHRLFELSPDFWWYFPVLFVAVDFFYYWWHRFSHEVRWLWATHSVHHSIEEMNFLAAYRFGWTERISLGTVIYAPLFLIGFHPVHMLMVLAGNFAYQAWLHTTLIGKLGFMEGILNTPSAHRVHHARNADYIDRNYGGVLVIWDRMFGTYEEEREDTPVEFGLINSSGSTNPIKIAFHEWVTMFHDLRANKLKHWPMLLFGAPGWSPDNSKMTSAKVRNRYLREKDAGKTNSDLPRASTPIEDFNQPKYASEQGQ